MLHLSLITQQKKHPNFWWYLNAQSQKHFRMSSLQTLKAEPEEMHMCEDFESSLSRKTDNFKNFLHGFLTSPSSLDPYYEISWGKLRPPGGSSKSRHCVSTSAITECLKQAKGKYTPETLLRYIQFWIFLLGAASRPHWHCLYSSSSVKI